MFALTKEDFFRFIKNNFYAPEWSTLDQFVITVTKRLLLSEAATAPGINFAGFNDHSGRLTGGDLWQADIGNCFHNGLFTGYKLIKIK